MAVITGKDEELLIGGRWVAAESGERFDVTNPATGEVVGTVPDGSESDVRAAIDAAADALEGWKSLPAIERARVLRRAADVIREQKDEIAAVMTAEQGKPIAEATGEVDYAAGFNARRSTRRPGGSIRYRRAQQLQRRQGAATWQSSPASTRGF